MDLLFEVLMAGGCIFPKVPVFSGRYLKRMRDWLTLDMAH